jgi:hypothetical protein
METTRLDVEFQPGSELTVATAVAAYRSRAAATDEYVRSTPLTQPTRNGDGTDLRWVVLHLINESARHAGHADATRELLDGVVGEWPSRSRGWPLNDNAVTRSGDAPGASASRTQVTPEASSAARVSGTAPGSSSDRAQRTAMSIVDGAPRPVSAERSAVMSAGSGGGGAPRVGKIGKQP